jgi:type IV pilus assembly protein PilF
LPILVVAAFALAACATTADEPVPRGGLDRISPVRAAEVNTRLGIGYLDRGQLEVAMEKLQTALEFDDQHVPAHVTLAMIYEEIGEEKPARRHYRRASRLAPSDGGTQNSYAVFLCRQGEFEKAEEHFLRAVRDPFYNTPAVAWANSGACARRAGDLERARQHLRQAVEIDPEFPDALYNLAEVYYQQGDAFRARAFLQRYESVVDPGPGELLLGFRIESNLGNASDARQYASRLEGEFPDSRQVRELRRQQGNDD